MGFVAAPQPTTSTPQCGLKRLEQKSELRSSKGAARTFSIASSGLGLSGKHQGLGKSRKDWAAEDLDWVGMAPA